MNNLIASYIELYSLGLLACTLPIIWISGVAIGRKFAIKIMGDPVKDSLICRIKSLEDMIKDQDDNVAWLRARLNKQAMKYETLLNNKTEC